MDIKDFGKQEELSFKLYDVTFYLRQLSFGQILKFQRALKNAHEYDTTDEELKSLHITTESAEKMIDFILDAVKKVEGLEDDGEPVEELTKSMLEDMPAELINEIFVQMNDIYAGNQEDGSKN